MAAVQDAETKAETKAKPKGQPLVQESVLDTNFRIPKTKKKETKAKPSKEKAPTNTEERVSEWKAWLRKNC